MNWVSVDTALPGFGVMVCAKVPELGGSGECVLRFCGPDKSAWNDTSGRAFSMRVTHWMHWDDYLREKFPAPAGSSQHLTGGMTPQAEIANSLSREHGRNIADIVATLSERAWRQGWLVGFAAGVAVTIIGYSLFAWLEWL